MIYTEEFLNEVTFTNAENLNRHYNDHVLKDGEKLDPENPKFPPMTKEEYAKRAKELSEAEAGLSSDRVSHIIGFKINKHAKKHNEDEPFRNVKIRKRCQFYPHDRFCEEVIYVDDDIQGREIITYFVGRRGKINRELKSYCGELDENKDKIDTTQAMQILSTVGES